MNDMVYYNYIHVVLCSVESRADDKLYSKYSTNPALLRLVCHLSGLFTFLKRNVTFREWSAIAFVESLKEHKITKEQCNIQSPIKLLYVICT